MPRFVILEHTVPPTFPRGSHLDVMFEAAAGLETWAIPRLPVAGESLRADKLPLHRVAYLDYEGPVSDDRGSVRRLGSGSYEPIGDDAYRVESEDLCGVIRFEPDGEFHRVFFEPGS